MRILYRFITLLCLFQTSTLFAIPIEKSVNDLNSIENKWQLWDKNNAISVSYRDADIADLTEIKASVIVDSSLSGFLLFIQDVANTPNWLVSSTKSTLIKQLATNEHLFSIEFEKIWPLKPRLLTLHSTYWQNSDLSLDISLKAGLRKEYSNKKLERFIVVHLYRAHWSIVPTLTKQGIPQLHITYTFLADGAGDSPKWLIDHFALKSMFKSMKNLRKQLPTSKWQLLHIKGIKELTKETKYIK